MISLQEFHQDFLQSILSDTESRGLMKPQAFFENVCEELVSSGDLTNNYTPAEYSKRGVEIHGYDFDEERKLLSLIVHQFFQDDEIRTLTKKEIEDKFKRLTAFFSMVVQGKYEEMEETSAEYSMSFNIAQYLQNKAVKRVRLIILTDGKMTKTLSDLPSSQIGDFPVEYRVIDIDYIYRIHLSEFTEQNFEIEVDLPYLEVDEESQEYQSFLSVVPASLLVNVYERFGQKLFEQNVRTFLQFKGNVNKGLRNTLEGEPERFFAYNNGITATASDVNFDKNGRISKIVNFQIVNGGQTTSAIYAASKNLKLDISNVSVQMKLSVMKDKEKLHNFVSKVSEYANTQNKVNKSDFFSNSPFHKEMKSYSKRMWVSTVEGSQRRTHWYYERARGEYLNEQLYLTKSQKNQFLLENPKHQFLDKTLVAKSEVSWLKKPQVVSKGAQYSFAYFAENVTRQLEEDDAAITEQYFKHIVARVILFREVEKLISKADWYDGGFRAQTVTYSIAYLSSYTSEIGYHFNFDRIWDLQTLPETLIEIMRLITEAVYDEITNPPAGTANISQYCKQEKCWDSVRKLKIDLKFDEKVFLDKNESIYTQKRDKDAKAIETGIEMQSFVVRRDLSVWKTLHEYFSKFGAASGISATQSDILLKMSRGTLGLPSEKQSKILYHLHKQAIDEGLVIPD